MGWTYRQGASRADIIRHLKHEAYDYAPLVTSAAVGNHYWQVRTFHGVNVIVVALLDRHQGYGWGYKDMSEDMGPYYYDCPVSFLELAPVASESWREGVRANHKARKCGKCGKMTKAWKGSIGKRHCLPCRVYYQVESDNLSKYPYIANFRVTEHDLTPYLTYR